MSGALGLVGEEYFTDPWKSLRSLLDGEPERLLADLPPRLAYDRRLLPLHVLEAGEDLHLYSAKRSGVVVLVSQSSGQIQIRSACGVPLPSEPPTRFGVEMTTIDLQKHFALPPTEERYWVGIVAGPYHSRVLPLELTSPTTRWQDPEVAAFVRRKRTRLGLGPRPVSALPIGGPLCWAESRLETPSTRAAGTTFVDLQAPRVVLPSESPSAVVKVRFRLSVKQTDVFASPVPVATFEENRPAREYATAGVPISLLVVDSLNGSPTTIHLHAPIFRALELNADDITGEGGLDLDLLAVEKIASRPRTYFVYAIAGSHLVGPAAVGVVDQALVASE